ncbi:hypothetical protein BP6252_08232 [Coleophoma cylindrospora]|uniref:Transcription factor domain-containing protein n=1 Tax=Coleophoma cylindrospora TaxID=1849047 RepID=A0A3D8R573_9HELO|nr:hypothetical protein BP6252_08232 [Coleophoma cylindrospora]
MADYCLNSRNRTVSLGYLNGLEALIERAGPASSVAEACRTIGMAHLGQKLSNPAFMQKANKMYFGLLPSFRLTISNKATSTTVHSLMTAVLLGLYEIITSTGTKPGAHIAHARGVSAILTSKSSPFNLLCEGKLFQLASPLPLEELRTLESRNATTSSLQKSEKFSILCTPIDNTSWPTLDAIFVKMHPLVRRAEAALADKSTLLEELQHFKQEAEQIRKDYSMWAMNIPKEWQPTVVGTIPNTQFATRLEPGYWPGPVTKYYDLYVSSILNSYRKARLLLLDVIVNCDQAISRLQKNVIVDPTIFAEIQELTLDITASIPYHLADNLQEFFDQSLSSDGTMRVIVPGRSVGGLFLMHTLYMVATLSIADPALKEYFKDCLAWIGRNMGIGQATMLSETTHLDLQGFITEAHVLIWAGMLA